MRPRKLLQLLQHGQQARLLGRSSARRIGRPTGWAVRGAADHRCSLSLSLSLSRARARVRPTLMRTVMGTTVRFMPRRSAGMSASDRLRATVRAPSKDRGMRPVGQRCVAPRARSGRATVGAGSTNHVTSPSGYRLPYRPARPAICLICAAVSGRTDVPSDFCSAEKITRRMLLLPAHPCRVTPFPPVICVGRETCAHPHRRTRPRALPPRTD